MKSNDKAKPPAKGSAEKDDLPPQLEYLRTPALEFDFGRLERAIRAETAGLSTKDAAAKKAAQAKLLRVWLERHEMSDEPLAIGLRFVAMLLE
jgi:hypothetical protein